MDLVRTLHSCARARRDRRGPPPGTSSQPGPGREPGPHRAMVNLGGLLADRLDRCTRREAAIAWELDPRLLAG
jgi:hypothetical protein